MHRSLKRNLVICLAALAVAAFAGGAYAATQNSGPTTRQAFLNDVAKRLHVTPQQLSAALSGATTDQADSAIDQLNTVRGQELAILFKEAGPQLTKVSIRSRDQVDAAELAGKFGGGGHRRAAGIELALSLKEAEARVLAVVRARMTDLA